MSSTHLPRPDQSTRAWWSLASKSQSSFKPERSFPSEKPPNPTRLPTKPSNGLRFNSLASAIRFKSKKHPSLAIQEPPAPIKPHNTSVNDAPSVQYSGRPPARSDASTVRSWDDPNEPQTPSDRERLSYPQSVLTLSDADPFASRGITLAQATHDPNRLSVFSNSSMSDATPKKNDRTPSPKRSSYASSSSFSHSHEDQSLEDSPVSQPETSDGRRASPRISSQPAAPRTNTMASASQVKNHIKSSRTGVAAPSPRTLAKSGSSSTLTDKKRSSDPDPSRVHRVPMRARGMTDTGAWGSPSIPQFLRKTPVPSKSATPPRSPTSPVTLNNPPARPRVVVRQPSSSRIGLPPTAPPSHTLPPPPIETRLGNESTSIRYGDCSHSSSSSSLSFASAASSSKDTSKINPRIPGLKESKRAADRDSSSVHRMEGRWDRGLALPIHMGEPSGSLLPLAISPPRVLKKASSHQTLVKRAPPSNTSSVPATPVLPMSATLEERGSVPGPRKQRSFHHPRIPLPPLPLPLRHANSCTPIESSPVDSRRDSSSSAPTRKRLFSGSSLRRPSTSQTTTTEDDARSVFSLPSESDRGQNVTFINPFSPDSGSSSSLWDEASPDNVPRSPAASTHEYVPQHIMSPAELREMEASFESESADFDPANILRGYPISLIPSPTSDRGKRESSSVKSLSPSLSKYRERVLNSQSTGTNGVPLRRSSLNVEQGMDGHLHHNLRPSTSTSEDNAISTMSPSRSSFLSSHSAGLPPPPRPRHRPSPNPKIDFQPPERPTTVVSLPPPPRRSQRSQTVRDKATLHRSIIRKPSFLEIDDDTHKRFSRPIDASFLDLESTRGSLDTVHTIEEHEGAG